MEDDPEERRSGFGGLLVAGVLVGTALAALGWYWAVNRKGLVLNLKGFDVSAVAPQAAPPGMNTRPDQPEVSMMIKSDNGIGFAGDGATPRATGAAAGPAGGVAAVPDDERRSEADFLARHGAELRRYEQRLGPITSRYYRQSPAVRRVDADFTHMPRYMALKRRYQQDGNPFQFLRGAISLPEVQGEIARDMTDPQVWSAALGMINDALKDPPPPAVYQQAEKFMTEDPTVTGYLPQFTKNATQDMPLAANAIPPGADLSGMQKIVNDVSPGSAPSH